MEIKPGVFGRLHVALVPVAAEYEHWRRTNGYASGTITAVQDGTHSSMSWHYEGRAVDLRIHDMKADDVQKMVHWLRTVFTRNHGFDILLEPSHLHIEYEGRWIV